MIENAEKRLFEYISKSEMVISLEGLEEVKHFYEHGEYEMSFEGLVIEFMRINVYPTDFNFSDWKQLALDYGLHNNSVFDGDFWNKFYRWGKSYPKI
ncbi:hypothetical protein C8Z91_23730 [Paenibacillus elgii]|uniref:Uncharacterized protein n=1 Tax=Paenibacillus elgii TaxID=189691 RepID=A0A2T6FWZ2_9BACL|nr:hypothetical protein [Paenibacillus elgii]PUA36421.1 hypothetical protein C8Z91_23730 [Paenibacillus elgii]